MKRVFIIGPSGAGKLQGLEFFGFIFSKVWTTIGCRSARLPKVWEMIAVWLFKLEMPMIRLILFWLVLSCPVWAQVRWADVSKDKLISEARAGDPAAQYELASRYAQIEGRLRDSYLKRAYRWYKAAAEQGHVEAQWELGSISWGALGLNHEINGRKLKREWLRKAAEQGHLEARLSFCQKLPGCPEGEAMAQWQGWCLWIFENRRDYKVWPGLFFPFSRSELTAAEINQMTDWCRQGMEQGSAEAGWLLGRAFLLGINKDIDWEQAKVCFEKAQEHGYRCTAMLQDSMGDAYRHLGKAEEALYCYQQALASEHCPYMIYEKMGDLYRLGDGVPRDDAKALQYYLDGVDSGFCMYAAGFYRKIGDMYVEGIGTAEDKKAARKWHAKARDADKRMKKWMQRFEYDYIY